MPSWQEACEAKKAAQEALIPQAWRLPNPPLASQLNVMHVPRSCGILSQRDLEITEVDDVAEVVGKLQSGEWKALEVTEAYCKRAAVAQQLVNCLTEIMFDDALKRAKELDDIFAKTGKPVGPLHGLPISLKDQFAIKGVGLCMGLAGWIGNVSDRDCIVVTILRNAGAVFHCRTNISQTLMFGETNNHVFGQTSNPYNRTLTCGGSSGGEGALVAMKGSPLGLGTDIGGSVRIPAGFNGLYGLRPTYNRLPYRGLANTLLGLEAVTSVLGPISRSPSGVILLLSILLAAEPWLLDPKVPEIPWRNEMLAFKHLKSAGKLTFGYYAFDGTVMPHPPVVRAVKMVMEALEAAGHEVIDFMPFDHARGNDIVGRIYTSDGGEDLRKTLALSGESAFPNIAMDLNGRGLSCYESWQLNLERDRYREEYLDHWNASAAKASTGRIDGIIAPMAPHVAAVHNTFNYIGFTRIYNLLDYPTCTLPVTFVDPKLDLVDSSYNPVNKDDEINYKEYTAETYAGAPVCVQIVGRRYREEEVCGLVELATEALKAQRAI